MEVPGFSRGLSPSAMSLRAWRGLLHYLSYTTEVDRPYRYSGSVRTAVLSFPRNPKGRLLSLIRLWTKKSYQAPTWPSSSTESMPLEASLASV